MSTNDDLILKEYELKCDELKTEKMRLIAVRKKLIRLNKKYENTSASLLCIKNECEHYKSNLSRTLFNHQVSLDKQKILCKKKLDEVLESRRRSEEYLKGSPSKFVFEELVKKNTILQEKCKKMTDLLQLTKQQHNQLLNEVMDTFKKKVCEFSVVLLQQNAENTTQWK